MKLKTALITFIIFFSSSLAYAEQAKIDEQALSPLASAIEKDLKKSHLSGISLKSSAQMNAFYKTRNYEPAWSNGKNLNANAKEFLSMIEHSYLDGLPPSLYHLPELEKLFKISNEPGHDDITSIFAHLDILMTEAFFLMAANFSNGITYPFRTGFDLYKPGKELDLPVLLENALSSKNGIAQMLGKLKPSLSMYGYLRDELARYRTIAQKGGWPLVGNIEGKEKKIEPGQTNSIIPFIRKRLMATDKLKQVGEEKELIYDEDLVEAVKSYQSTYGLNADGVIGQLTLDALNTSVEERICQMSISLDRIRALSDVLGGNKYIMANIPAFELNVVENGKSALNMRVIVGTYRDKSPLLNELMQYVIFSPKWHVPESIAIKEELGKLQADPHTFRRRGMRVYRRNEGRKEEIEIGSIDWGTIDKSSFEYSFVQDSGGGNALGGIKFLFPNKESVYMHDTPTKPLFQRDTRAFSHGCIRIEKPVAMAEYLLKDETEWTTEKIVAASKLGRERTVTLKEKIPVHIIYLTAWADESGKAQFRRDVYHYDKALQKIFCKK